MEARMWTAIDSLPERRRETFLLCKRDGLKYEEIADRLGISVNTVKNQVSKALKTIKDGSWEIYFFFFG
jgi:RNA polymerase sigma-70 factor (ECF subfamily)